MPQYALPEKLVPRAEEAAIELACSHNNVNTIVVCGHSDCKVLWKRNGFEFFSKNLTKTNFSPLANIKAMNLVFSSRNDRTPSNSLLKNWVMMNTKNSLEKYYELEKENFKKPLKYSSLLILFYFEATSWQAFFCFCFWLILDHFKYWTRSASKHISIQTTSSNWTINFPRYFALMRNLYGFLWPFTKWNMEICLDISKLLPTGIFFAR